jgi:RHS repeat-associated protein
MFDKWRSNYDSRILTKPVGAPLLSDPDYYRFPDTHLNKYLQYPQPLLRSVALERPDGKTFWFTQWSGGAWTTDPDVPGTLSATTSGWTYTLRDGTVETYDISGRLVRITDRTGLSQTLTYSSDRLESVTNAFGHSLRFASGTVTDHAGQSIRYSYGEGGNLTRVDYPNGTAKLYHYDDSRFPGHLTGISHVEANGTTNRFATFTYDATGKAASTEHAGGMEKFTLNYDWATQTTVTNAAGTKMVLSFTTAWGAKNLTRKTNYSDYKGITQTYDGRNNLICRSDEEGRVTTYTYNGLQKVSMTEGQSGNCTTPTLTTATRTTTYQYLSTTLDLPTLIQSPSVAGGSNTKQVGIAYDAQRNPVTITQSGFTPAGVAVARSIALGYNAFGQVTSIDGPRTDVADVTHISYYNCTTGGACGQIQSVTNALGQTTTYDQYDANGRVLGMTDPNGLKTVYTYDPRGRVSSIAQTAPGEASRLTQYGYDTAGNITFVSLPTGYSLTYTYDAALKLRRVTDSLGNRVDYNYDLKGNRTQAYTYDTAGTLTRAIDVAYDARNRVSQINAGGSITKQVWDAVGNLTKITDPNTVAANGTTAKLNFYDSLNRLFKTVDCGYALSSACFLVNGNNQYTYDVNDRVKTVSAPNGALTQYAYDDLGNLLSETSPDRGTLTYSYDAAGNVITLRDARGITVGYSYDALNRLTQATYPDSAENITYHYDSCTLGRGRLCRAQDAAGASDYTYDAFGNVATHRRTELSVAYTTSYGYDPGNRIITITYPNGRQVSHARDARGNIQATSMTLYGVSTPLVSGGVFRPDGLPLTRTFGNGLADTRLYDTQGRLRELYLGNADTRLYAYDANGNLTGKQTLPEVGAYAYDALDRLKQEDRTTQATVTTNWTYDANGNRKTQNLGSYAYLASSNRLQSAPGGAITLDAAGNTLSDGSRSYTYNHAGHLSTVAGAGYSYNSQRLRSRKILGSQATVYHYDLAGNLIAETDADGNLIRDYVWTDAMPIAQVEAGETLTYLHTDHLNTPRLGTDAQGQVVWRWDGTAFGESVPTGSRTVNLRFPGQYYDVESGLHYNWHRYYDPRVGRYVTSDPIGLEGGLNSYVYTNRPLNEIDLEGLMGNAPGNGGQSIFPILPAMPHVDYPRRAGLRPDRRTQDAMQCLANCLKRDITVTGAKEGDPHKPNSAHRTGQACDVGKNSNRNISRSDIDRCFPGCTGPDIFIWGYEGEENFHFQTRPGEGGATGFPSGIKRY